MHLKKNGKAGTTQWLVIRGVPFDGRLVDVSLGLEDNPANEKRAQAKIKKIQDELFRQAFHFEEHFPTHPKLKKAREQAAQAAKIASEKASTTLAEYIATWLTAQEAKATLVPETLGGYRDHLNHVLADKEIASKPLAAISEDDVHAFRNRLIKKHVSVVKDADGNETSKTLSPNHVNKILDRLRSVFNDACRKRLADGSRLITESPTQFVKSLRKQKPQIDPFEHDEAIALIGVAEGWFKNYLTVALFAGLRPSEILALTWNDIDWRRGLILVRRTMSRSGIRAPKTVGSERDVEMAELVRAALAAQRAKSGLSISGLVFPSYRDTPMSIHNVRALQWNQLMIKARVRRRPLYQCRHSFASMALARGVNIRWLAAQMGHSSISMIVTTYSRWLGSEVRSAPDQSAKVA